MALYNLDTTSNESLIDSLEYALNIEGLITTKHRHTISNLIITTPMLTNRVIRFFATSQRLYYYYGTAYVSGDTIENSITISAIAIWFGEDGIVCVTDDVLFVSVNHGSLVVPTFIVGILDNVASTQIIMGASRENNTGIIHDAGTRELIFPRVLKGTLLSSNEKFYKLNIMPVSDNSYHYLASGIVGIKQILKNPDFSQTHLVLGDDIVIPVGGAQGDYQFFNTTFLIENGAI